MAQACVGATLFRVEVPVKLFRAGRTDFQTDLGLPKGRRQVRDWLSRRTSLVGLDHVNIRMRMPKS